MPGDDDKYGMQSRYYEDGGLDKVEVKFTDNAGASHTVAFNADQSNENKIKDELARHLDKGASPEQAIEQVANNDRLTNNQEFQHSHNGGKPPAPEPEPAPAPEKPRRTVTEIMNELATRVNSDLKYPDHNGNIREGLKAEMRQAIKDGSEPGLKSAADKLATLEAQQVYIRNQHLKDMGENHNSPETVINEARQTAMENVRNAVQEHNAAHPAQEPKKLSDFKGFNGIEVKPEKLISHTPNPAPLNDMQRKRIDNFDKAAGEVLGSDHPELVAHRENPTRESAKKVMDAAKGVVPEYKMGDLHSLEMNEKFSKLQRDFSDAHKFLPKESAQQQAMLERNMKATQQQQQPQKPQQPPQPETRPAGLSARDRAMAEQHAAMLKNMPPEVRAQMEAQNGLRQPQQSGTAPQSVTANTPQPQGNAPKTLSENTPAAPVATPEIRSVTTNSQHPQQQAGVGATTTSNSVATDSHTQTKTTQPEVHKPETHAPAAPETHTAPTTHAPTSSKTMEHMGRGMALVGTAQGLSSGDAGGVTQGALGAGEMGAGMMGAEKVAQKFGTAGMVVGATVEAYHGAKEKYANLSEADKHNTAKVITAINDGGSQGVASGAVGMGTGGLSGDAPKVLMNSGEKILKDKGYDTTMVNPAVKPVLLATVGMTDAETRSKAAEATTIGQAGVAAGDLMEAKNKFKNDLAPQSPVAKTQAQDVTKYKHLNNLSNEAFNRSYAEQSKTNPEMAKRVEAVKGDFSKDPEAAKFHDAAVAKAEVDSKNPAYLQQQVEIKGKEIQGQVAATEAKKNWWDKSKDWMKENSSVWQATKGELPKDSAEYQKKELDAAKTELADYSKKQAQPGPQLAQTQPQTPAQPQPATGQQPTPPVAAVTQPQPAAATQPPAQTVAQNTPTPASPQTPAANTPPAAQPSTPMPQPAAAAPSQPAAPAAAPSKYTELTNKALGQATAALGADHPAVQKLKTDPANPAYLAGVNHAAEESLYDSKYDSKMPERNEFYKTFGEIEKSPEYQHPELAQTHAPAAPPQPPQAAQNQASGYAATAPAPQRVAANEAPGTAATTNLRQEAQPAPQNQAPAYAATPAAKTPVVETQQQATAPAPQRVAANEAPRTAATTNLRQEAQPAPQNQAPAYAATPAAKTPVVEPQQQATAPAPQRVAANEAPRTAVAANLSSGNQPAPQNQAQGYSPQQPAKTPAVAQTEQAAPATTAPGREIPPHLAAAMAQAKGIDLSKMNQDKTPSHDQSTKIGGFPPPTTVAAQGTSVAQGRV